MAIGTANGDGCRHTLSKGFENASERGMIQLFAEDLIFFICGMLTTGYDGEHNQLASLSVDQSLMRTFWDR